MQATVVEACRMRERKHDTRSRATKNEPKQRSGDDYTTANSDAWEQKCAKYKPPKKSKNKKVTLKQIKTACGNHCCACCSLIIEYFKQVVKLCCCAQNANTGCLTKICCELADVSCCLGRDVIQFMKYVFRCFLNF